jgi:hypothetical protein
VRDGDGRKRDDGRRAGRSDGSGGIAALARIAAEQLGEVTGRRAEFVSSMERSDDGWRMTVEVLELERVPDSTSVLGSYEVRTDGRGDLLEYTRVRRYLRNQSDQWEE